MTNTIKLFIVFVHRPNPQERNKVADGRHFEKIDKNFFAMVWPISRKFDTVTHNDPLKNPGIHQNSQLLKIQDCGRHPYWKYWIAIPMQWFDRFPWNLTRCRIVVLLIRSNIKIPLFKNPRWLTAAILTADNLLYFGTNLTHRNEILWHADAYEPCHFCWT